MKHSQKQFFKVFVSFVTALFFILIPYSLLLNPNYFTLRFDIYSQFEEDKKPFAEKNFHNIFNYLNNTEELNKDFFSYEDQIHLKDVKTIVGIYYFLCLILLFIILIFILNKVYYPEYSLYLHGIILLLIIILLANFESTFISFHKILFRNDYWMLDPNSSNLIKYFSDNIFREVSILASFFGIIIHSLIVLQWTKRRKK